ncbi:FemAB family XrtA/PEP-CTERM system-associated protein [Mesorhizobium muleiense]|uniref:FemAB-related protein, PEP-CTERM system-associated n=1 Tax=Mesorhizobium muleiense TaxID=1004279 RepID=A0A1G8L4J3_9HYPH|nr:FemAB family XrtA/PEP-CTERM system-associated protein [Mesorhizobium muleiense]MCF6100420.1 FemAB family PEP-CTERM system-associated protein [Mesorhizobium muleiense]SDI50477.1 FemAB-related protein, PEP-CTERM system-associated [Mesorhizobium muleiense]
MASVEIVDTARAGLDHEWDAYVNASPNRSCYHFTLWRDILQRSFGHRPYYLMARSGGATCGVLPLFEMKSRLFGHSFVSLPFVNYGGILADGLEIEEALAKAAIGLAQGRGAGHIELRQTFATSQSVGASWQVRQHKAALIVSIEADPQIHWSGLSSRLRGKVRKAQRAGVEFSRAGHEALDDFYRVFSKNMRDLGTPVHSPVFFRSILESTADSQILLVRLGGKPVAAALAMRTGDVIELPWVCSDYDAAFNHVNEYLYWKAIELACESGASDLDLGRSTIGAGTYTFKIQWKPQVKPLFWCYWLAAGKAFPELAPSNPKYAFAITCWKKLPISIANGLGPHIVRNIP